jgi:hypothetical protein
MGLPNIRKNSDEFRLSSVPGQGTKVESVIQVTAEEDGKNDAERTD